MKIQTALSVAIKSMASEAHSLAINANLFDHFGLNTPVGRSASKRKADLESAIVALYDLKEVLKEINYAD